MVAIGLHAYSASSRREREQSENASDECDATTGFQVMAASNSSFFDEMNWQTISDYPGDSCSPR
jgi:hypothetical protein